MLTSSHDKVFSAGRQPRRLRCRRAARPQALRHRAVPELFRTIGQLGKPTICAANGHVLAGSLGIALACDLIVANEKATFGTPEINVGVFPFMIMALIYRNVGRKKTNELLLLGERISAREALDIGLVNKVVAPKGIEYAVRDWAEQAGEQVAGDHAARQGRDVPPAGHGVRRRARVPAPQPDAVVLDRGHPGGRQGVLREARAAVDAAGERRARRAALPDVRPDAGRGARRRRARAADRQAPRARAAPDRHAGRAARRQLGRGRARLARLPARGGRPGRRRADRRQAAGAARRRVLDRADDAADGAAPPPRRARPLARRPRRLQHARHHARAAASAAWRSPAPAATGTPG